MTKSELRVIESGFGQTIRTDAWWVQPVFVFLGLSTFIIYSTWAAFQAQHYAFGPYLSPFYSPEIFGSSSHNWFDPSRNGGRFFYRGYKFF